MLRVAEILQACVAELVGLCPICSKPHQIEFLKPTVCKNPLCQFQYVHPPALQHLDLETV